jgi:hypothetical protein
LQLGFEDESTQIGGANGRRGKEGDGGSQAGSETTDTAQVWQGLTLAWPKHEGRGGGGGSGKAVEAKSFCGCVQGDLDDLPQKRSGAGVASLTLRRGRHQWHPQATLASSVSFLPLFRQRGRCSRAGVLWPPPPMTAIDLTPHPLPPQGFTRPNQTNIQRLQNVYLTPADCG